MIKALLVDDSKLIRQVEKTVFAHIGGVEIEEAADGAEALGKLMIRKYDILILDWMMPKMTGEQLLREIRSVPGPNKDIPTK
jgi:two-component system chemotaxis response regulator CheY